MMKFKFPTVGGSEGFILKKEAKAKLNVARVTFLTEAPDGALRITAYDPDFETQMKLVAQNGGLAGCAT